MLRLFISDMHLQSDRPDISDRVDYFLKEIAPGSDELYLLGDLFEAWIGDDARDPAIDRFALGLSELANSGTRIYIQHGNRDFLIRAEGAQRLSAELLPEYFTLTLAGGKALLVHGDQLCTDDHDYQNLRKKLRAPAWQEQFLALPLSEREEIASNMRDASRRAGLEKSEEIMDVNSDAVKAVMDEHEINLLIHGHTHRPKVHRAQRNEHQGVRVVLGDWDEAGWYLLSDEARFELHRFSINSPSEDRAITI